MYGTRRRRQRTKRGREPGSYELYEVYDRDTGQWVAEPGGWTEKPSGSVTRKQYSNSGGTQYVDEWIGESYEPGREPTKYRKTSFEPYARPDPATGFSKPPQTGGYESGSPRPTLAPAPPATLGPQGIPTYTPDELRRGQAIAQLRDAAARAQKVDSWSGAQSAYRDAKAGSAALVDNIAHAYIDPAAQVLADGLAGYLDNQHVAASLNRLRIPASETNYIVKALSKVNTELLKRGILWTGGKVRDLFTRGVPAAVAPYVDILDLIMLPAAEADANIASRRAEYPWYDLQAKTRRYWQERDPDMLHPDNPYAPNRRVGWTGKRYIVEPEVVPTLEYRGEAIPAARAHYAPYTQVKPHYSPYTPMPSRTSYPDPTSTQKQMSTPYHAPRRSSYGYRYGMYRPYPTGRRGYRRSQYLFSRY